jgi:hypothetical protein
MPVTKIAETLTSMSAYRKYKPGKDIDSAFSFVSARVIKPGGTPPDVANIVSRRKKVDATGNIVKTSGVIGTALKTMKNVGKNTLTYGVPALTLGMAIPGSKDAVDPANSEISQPAAPAEV